MVVGYAGFWRRLAAFVVDQAILSVILLLTIPFGVVGQVLSFVVVVAYFVGFWSRSGQTPGKAALGVRIVNADGTAIGPGVAVRRFIGYIVSGFILCIGFLLVAFHPRKQGLHDLIAGTQVILVPSSMRELCSQEESDAALATMDDIQRQYHGL